MRTAHGDGQTALENELLGNRVGRDGAGALAFRADGTGSMQGLALNCSALDGMLLMPAGGGMVAIAPYQLDALGALSLIFGEQPVAFDRS